jgi:hypothetical protein
MKLIFWDGIGLTPIIVLVSSLVVLILYVRKLKDSCAAKENGLEYQHEILVDEMADYVNERERAIELHNHYCYKVEQLVTEFANVEARYRDLDVKEKSLADDELGLKEREAATETKVLKMKGQLNGSREKARKLEKKCEDLNARLSDTRIEKE